MILLRSPNARWITLHILNTRVIWCHFQTAPIVVDDRGLLLAYPYVFITIQLFTGLFTFFHVYCKYIKNHICVLRLKKQFESNLHINEHYLSSSEAYGIWTHDLCDTELTSQLGAGPQLGDMIFINLQLFILPFTGLFETNIITSSQVAYTTVRLSAFNYHCLQLTRLVQRRSLQNNAYGYLTKRQRYVYKHETIATSIDSIAL